MYLLGFYGQSLKPSNGSFEPFKNKFQWLFVQATLAWTILWNMSTLTLNITRERWRRRRGCHEWEKVHPRLSLYVHGLVHYHRRVSWCNDVFCAKSKRMGSYTLYPTPIYISPPSNMTKHMLLWRWGCGGEDHLELEGEKATCPMPSNTLIFEICVKSK